MGLVVSPETEDAMVGRSCNSVDQYAFEGKKKRRLLILVGGGKDNCVSASLLSEMHWE